MSIELVSLGMLTVEMTDSVSLAESPAGRRVVVEFSNCRWDGDRVRATQRGNTAGDWLTVGPDSTASLDIRIVFTTDDGATIYLQSGGRADARTFGKGGATWLAPRFETDAPAYRWLNGVQAVAHAAGTGKSLTFELFELRSVG
jgi:hypothetical protein